jgi:hypothetical protein
LVSAGILLALATIKPQMALLPILWAAVWALSVWSERKKLLVTLAVMAALFLVVGQILLPGWLTDFVAGLPAYGRYAGSDSLLTMLVGDWTGLTVSLLLGAIGVWAAHSCRKQPAASCGFQLTTALILGLAAIVMPAMAASHNQVLMFPGAFLLLRDARTAGFGLAAFFVGILAWTPISALAASLLGWKDFMLASKAGVGAVVPLILMVLLVRHTIKLNAGSNLGST